VSGTLAITALAWMMPAQPSQAAFLCHGATATIVGTNGADNLEATDDGDVIVGRGGRDTIDGKGGRDLVCGGAGSDRIVGGRGGDTLIGNGGNDILDGQAGNDQLFGGFGRDRLSGRDGKDRLRGGPADDRLDGGGSSFDSCNGRSGSDGGSGCELRRSIALLRFDAVTLHREPPGMPVSPTCRLNVVIRNLGDENATDVEIEGSARTLAFPERTYDDLGFDGPTEIPPNPENPVFSIDQYFADLDSFPPGGFARYVIRAHNGDTSVDTATTDAGIECRP
jgi:hypothetical protein